MIKQDSNGMPIFSFDLQGKLHLWNSGSFKNNLLHKKRNLTIEAQQKI